MKKILLALILVVIRFTAFSQSMPPVEGVPLATPDDYRAAENVVDQVSWVLLSTPIDQGNETRLKAGVFLMRWMYGTPDFDFTFEQKVMNRYIEKDIDLMGVYYASLTAFAIEFKSVKDPKTIALNAAKTFVAYIKNGRYNVIITKKLKKLVDANEKGELKSFLKL